MQVILDNNQQLLQGSLVQVNGLDGWKGTMEGNSS